MNSGQQEKYFSIFLYQNTKQKVRNRQQDQEIKTEDRDRREGTAGSMI